MKYFATSDEAVNLMKSGQYDVVSASGDASLRLIASGDVEPVNTELIPNYADLYDYLKDRDWNSVDGQMYGVPHGYGANLLMWRTDKVEPARQLGGRLRGGLAVRRPGHRLRLPDLHRRRGPLPDEDPAGPRHRGPVRARRGPLAAAVDLLKKQRQNVGEYWSDYLKEIQAFSTGDSVVGTTWQVIANVAQGENVPVEVTLPKEGATGWSDTWMVSANAAHKNCAYAWMNHIISPDANAAVAEYFGEAPSNPKACEIASKGHCESFHAGDEDYAAQIWYWTTPIEQCLDGRTDVKCTDYGDWTQAWTQVKG